MAEENVTVEEPEVNKEEEPELSDLEKREQELIQQEKEETSEGKEEQETEEIEDLDWDELKEKHPEIDKFGIKNMAELVEKYFGGLPDFQKNAEIVKELKKLGFETPSERAELFKKLAAKEDIKSPEKGEETTEKTFAEDRREKLAAFVHKYVRDEETGEVRETTDEEKKTQHDHLESLANAIVGPNLPDQVSRVETETTNLRDDLTWALFRLQPILEKFKDELIPDSIRDEIREHSKDFSRTYADIVQDALKKGQNFYGPVYHHFMSTTKKDLIEAEQKKRWEEEREKEKEKKKAAKGESAKTRTEIATSEKSWKDMTLPEKERFMIDQEAAGE